MGGRAFTLVELMVVVVIMSVLIGLIAVVGMRAVRHHKVTYTRTIMKSVHMAIDQFATEGPLRSRYDRADAQTFGPYPPYMLAGGGGGTSPYAVANLVEPYDPAFKDGFSGSPTYTLANRLWRDLGAAQQTVTDWTNLPGGRVDGNDDIRALYTYLRVYSPGVLAQIPERQMRPLDPANAEYVFPTGTGASATRLPVDVLGITDAWDVPLDYFLYVKLEWSPRAAGSVGGGTGYWRVADRIPVLRSRGVTAEEYAVQQSDPESVDASKWIFSVDFPSPRAYPGSATFRKDGLMPSLPTGQPGSDNGWVRAVGQGDDDPGGTLPADSPSLFGFVP